MKKAILTSGLFALMLILTSFTAQTDGIGNQGVPRLPSSFGYADGIGNQGVPRLPSSFGYADGIGNQGVPRLPSSLEPAPRTIRK